VEDGGGAARGLTDLRVFHPVQDLQAFLTGRWRIARRISDARLGLAGRLAGWADFVPSDDGLIHDEEGDLRFGAYQGPVTRRYHLVIDAPSAGMVRHADGSLFHALDLGSGRADILHRCGEDHYRGRYRVLDQDRFTVSWQVTGPRKQYRLATLHRRAEA
jgi:hypothetical protein